MPNKFVNTIVFVSDLEKSKHFYAELLNIKTIKDLDSMVFRFYDPDGHIVEFGEPLEDNL